MPAEGLGGPSRKVAMLMVQSLIAHRRLPKGFCGTWFPPAMPPLGSQPQSVQRELSLSVGWPRIGVGVSMWPVGIVLSQGPYPFLAFRLVFP